MPKQNSEHIQVKVLPGPPSSADEGPSLFVQQNVSQKKLNPAVINYLDDTQNTFYVHVSL